MRIVFQIIEAVVVTLCLPVFAVFYPFYVLGLRRTSAKISAQSCPFCGESLAAIDRDAVQMVGFMPRLAPGSTIDWDRLPSYLVRCPACGRHIYFDRRCRFTDTGRARAITSEWDQSVA